jgi:ribonucleoside-diphosphate reductase alpha chain
MGEELLVLRRNGEAVPWRREKIQIAVAQAFLAENRPEEDAVPIAERVERKIFARGLDTIDIESIQDAVQNELLARGEGEVARSYLAYRQRRAEARERAVAPLGQRTMIFLSDPDGTSLCWTGETMSERFEAAAAGLPLSISADLFARLTRDIGGEMEMGVLRERILCNALPLAKGDPVYAKFAAQLAIQFLYGEVLGHGCSPVDGPVIARLQGEYFEKYVREGVQTGRFDGRLVNFDLPTLAGVLEISRDRLLDWPAVELLESELLMRRERRAIETPQIFWMRVAMGIFIGDAGRRNDRVIALYQALSRLEFCPASTTLLYAGTPHPQLLPSYVYAVEDSLRDIMVRGIAENAFAAKWGAGLGGSWTAVRGAGTEIAATGGISAGIAPFLDLHRHQLAIATQGPHRRAGAGCAYLAIWHGDVEEFVTLRKNFSDRNTPRREPELQTSLWIPDLFMERLAAGDDRWTLFQPSDVPDLLVSSGEAFAERYRAYEGEEKIWRRQLSLRELWQKILALMFETGFPRLAFQDSFNRNRKGETIRASSLFGESAMAMDADETAGSAFGSISLPAQMVDGTGGLDWERYRRTIHLAIGALDAILDATRFPSPMAEKHCRRNRGLSLGISGLHDFLRRRGLPYDSEEAESEVGRIFTLLHGESRCAAGERNRYLNAQSPTGRTSRLLGVSPGSLPLPRNVRTLSLPGGEKVRVLDGQLADALKRSGHWSDGMGERLVYLEGDPESLPEGLREIFATAFDMDAERLISLAATIQGSIDQSQAFPLCLRLPTFTRLSQLLQLAWSRGIRSIGPLLTTHALVQERAREKFSG